MKFQDTPRELQHLARQAAEELTRLRFRVFVERAFNNNAPLRTTLLGQKGKESVLIEVQRKPYFGSALRDLAIWLNGGREFARLFLAISAESDIAGTVLRELKRYGVGLMMLDADGTVQNVQSAQTYALLVPPNPQVSLGSLTSKVCALCAQFNACDRKAALRDVFELV